MNNPDPADLQAQIRALQAQLAALEATTAEQKAEQKIENNPGIGINNRGELTARDIINVHGNIYHGEPTDDPAHALNIYREVTLNDCRALPLGGLDKATADPTNRDQPLNLAHVYVTLNTTQRQSISEGAREDNEEKQIPITAVGACGAHQRLVLTGHPGGGKSTFVTHLAYALCAHQLGRPGHWAEQLTPQYNALQPSQLTLLPLRVILRDFVASLPPKLPHWQTPLKALTDFIQETLRQQNLAFVWSPLEKALQAGQVWLLFDGLDEVTNNDQRPVVLKAVEAFAQRYPRAHILVTCRIVPYEDPTYQLPPYQFSKVELDDFDEAQRDAFINSWYDELVALGRVTAKTAETMTRKLQTGIRRSDLDGLAGNPLLLTIMAIVHTHKRRLPEGRAQLYEETIEILLWRWEEVKLNGEREAEEGGDIVTLPNLLAGAGRLRLDLHRVLARVAFEVHHQIQPEDKADKVADVGLAQLYLALAALHPQQDHGWAQKVVTVMRLRAGLLIEKDIGKFSFPHRTFQEYLAGVHLANSHNEEGAPDFPQRAAVLAVQPQWRTVILLAVGYLTYVKPDPYRVEALLAELCPADVRVHAQGAGEEVWQKVWLAGESVLEMGVARVQDTARGRELLARIQQGLVALIEGGYLTVRERAEVGQVLGQLGDPRPGVGVKNGVPDIVWGGVVPVGMYRIGGDKRAWNSFDKQEVPIKEAYQLAKYPITNAQFAAFVNAPDVHDPQWWEGLPEDEKQFSEPAWSTANHPRERVSWYQAVAFCRWLSAKLGYEVRLPHEHEWEVAARYGHGKAYPWGDDTFDQTKANTREGGVGQTTAVGLYPTGRQTELELYDMSGNVWEWCQNKYNNPDQVEVDDSRDSRARRGGSWVNSQGSARAAFRSSRDPHFRFSDVGWRVARGGGASSPISNDH